MEAAATTSPSWESFDWHLQARLRTSWGGLRRATWLWEPGPVHLSTQHLVSTAEAAEGVAATTHPLERVFMVISRTCTNWTRCPARRAT